MINSSKGQPSTTIITIITISLYHLNHMPRCQIGQIGLGAKCSRCHLNISTDRCSTMPLGNLFQCLTAFSVKKKTSNIKSRHLFVHLRAISSHLFTQDMAEDADAHLTTASSQAVVESNEVPPESPLLQTKQPQLP